MIFSVSRGLSQDVVSCDCVGPQQSQAKPSAFVKFFRSDGGIASSRQVAAPLLKHRKGSATCSTRIAGQAEMGSSKFQLGLIEQCIHMHSLHGFNSNQKQHVTAGADFNTPYCSWSTYMMRQTFCAQISAGSSIPRFHRMNETSCKGLQNEQRCPVWHHLGTASGLEAEYPLPPTPAVRVLLVVGAGAGHEVDSAVEDVIKKLLAIKFETPV